MNHVSIFEKKWLDLVFEGKNKSYGAYRLRLENQRTTLFALLLGLSLLASIAGIGILAARLTAQAESLVQVIDDGPTIVPVDLTPPPPKPQTNTTPVTPIDEPDNEKPMLDNPTVVEHHEATDDELSKKPTAPDVPEGQTGVPGNNPTSGTTGPTTTTGTGTTPAPSIVNEVVLPGALDEQPEYPGGIKNFYKYVGDNFKKPELDDANTVTVYVSFVIEKDGSMTDIKVLRDPGYGMGREALRVLKANKAQWRAGKKNGNPVRTAYTLPITVNIQ